MPKGYEEIRDKFKKQGYSTAMAKKHAAMIWNSRHKGSQAVGRGKK